MQIVYERCCGIDVHKKKIVATLRMGRRVDTRQYGTFTSNLRELTTWLKEARCQIVAMESTGVYWKPLYNIFELEGIEAIVVNAQHMKAVPGHKTDVKDSEWIADLLQHGLLKASFIPDRKQREYRDLTRYRKSRIEERARELNRLDKMLESANIKLSSVISHLNSKAGQNYLNLITSDKEITHAAVLSKYTYSLKAGVDEILESLQGVLSPVQKLLIKEIMHVIQEQTAQIDRIEALIVQYCDEEYRKIEEALVAIPGIGKRSAQQIIAETGIDMSRFPSANHLCSWAGICPGNNESAGKRKTGKTNHGNHILKSTLVECAQSCILKKDSYFQAQYNRICVRRGRKRAIVAVAHSMLIAIYHVIKGSPFRDLGGDYFNQFNRERKIESHLQKLKKLGWSPPVPAVPA
jgi:transposase